jgi:hypothetical protein
MLLAAALAGVLFAQAAPAAGPAQTPPAAEAKAAKPEKPKKPKLICTTEQPTDSFIAKRVCRTPEQIEAERNSSRRTVDDSQDINAAACRGRC